MPAGIGPKESVGDLKIPMLVPGKWSTVLYLPAVFHALIGQVVVHWGAFEVLFDACLESLLNAYLDDGGKLEERERKPRSFRKRAELFMRLSDAWVSKHYAQAAPSLNALLQKAVSTARQRNMIAHGTFAGTLPPYSSTFVDCYAKNALSGEKMPVDEKILTQLYHDISHLTGDLYLVWQEIGSMGNLPFGLIPDAEILDLYERARKAQAASRAAEAPKPGLGGA